MGSESEDEVKTGSKTGERHKENILLSSPSGFVVTAYPGGEQSEICFFHFRRIHLGGTRRQD